MTHTRKDEDQLNDEARERANANPEADLASARESKAPDDDPGQTLMD
jgi:hypothetical protein